MGEMMATGVAPGHALNPGPIYQVPFAAGLSLALAPTNVGGAQVLLAESAVRVDAMEQLMCRYGDALQAYGNGRRQMDTLDLRLRSFAWRAWLARETRDIVTQLFTHTGATAIYGGNALQRRWRDLHAMAQHVVLNYETASRNLGRFLAGQEPEPGLY